MQRFLALSLGPIWLTPAKVLGSFEFLWYLEYITLSCLVNQWFLILASVKAGNITSIQCDFKALEFFVNDTRGIFSLFPELWWQKKNQWKYVNNVWFCIDLKLLYEKYSENFNPYRLCNKLLKHFRYRELFSSLCNSLFKLKFFEIQNYFLLFYVSLKISLFFCLVRWL